MPKPTEELLPLSKRPVLIHVERRVEDEYERLTQPSVDDEACLVRHRRGKELAVCRLTWLQSVAGIRRIAHRNVAAIHGIFQHSQAAYLVYEHVEVPFQELVFTDEIQLASALSQVVDGIHHLVAENIRFPIESVRVSRCGVVKIVLDVCFKSAADGVDGVDDVDQYWPTVYEDLIAGLCQRLRLRQRLLYLSFAARQFLSNHNQQILPGTQHPFLHRSNGPDGLVVLVRQALETKQTAVLGPKQHLSVPNDLFTRVCGQKRQLKAA